MNTTNEDKYREEVARLTERAEKAEAEVAAMMDAWYRANCEGSDTWIVVSMRRAMGALALDAGQGWTSPDDNARLCERLENADARIAALEAALRQYGRRAHDPRNCAVYAFQMGQTEEPQPCSCGAAAYNAAIDKLLGTVQKVETVTQQVPLRWIVMGDALVFSVAPDATLAVAVAEALRLTRNTARIASAERDWELRSFNGHAQHDWSKPASTVKAAWLTLKIGAGGDKLLGGGE